MGWTDLTQEEADRIARRQEHSLTEAIQQLPPGRTTRALVIRRSVAWVTAWLVTGYALWQTMPG